MCTISGLVLKYWTCVCDADSDTHTYTRTHVHTHTHTHCPGNSRGFPHTDNRQHDQLALSPRNYRTFEHINTEPVIRFQRGTQHSSAVFFPPPVPPLLHTWLLNKQTWDQNIPPLPRSALLIGQERAHVTRLGQRESRGERGVRFCVR